jgi:hypothetical protein
MLRTASLRKDFSHLLIMGDFNYPKIDWISWTTTGDKEGESFIEVIRDCYLYQHVLKNTRARIDCEPSALDLIFTNDEEMIEDISYDEPLGHSDHGVLDFTFRCYFSIKDNPIPRWNFHKGDYTKMSEEMKCDWDDILSGMNVNDMNDTFLEIFNRAKHKCIPQVNSRAKAKAKRHNYLPLDEKSIRKIKKKHRCWQRYMETRDGKKYQEYAKARNQTKRIVRKAKTQMEKEIAKNVKTNPKRF